MAEPDFRGPEPDSESDQNRRSLCGHREISLRPQRDLFVATERFLYGYRERERERSLCGHSEISLWPQRDLSVATERDLSVAAKTATALAVRPGGGAGAPDLSVRPSGLLLSIETRR